jgi:hypothetical protein
LADLPGMVRDLLKNGKLVKAGNFSATVNFLGSRIRKVGLGLVIVHPVGQTAIEPLQVDAFPELGLGAEANRLDDQCRAARAHGKPIQLGCSDEYPFSSTIRGVGLSTNADA